MANGIFEKFNQNMDVFIHLQRHSYNEFTEIPTLKFVV
jgi:hypothetical protein